MKTLTIQISAILISLLLISNVFAIKGVQFMCGCEIKEVTTPSLSNKLVGIQQAFKDEKYEEACNLIDLVLQNTNAPEFATESFHGPLALQLKAEKVYYKMFPPSYNVCNPESKQVALATLEEYQAEAVGKTWSGYSLLYIRLIEHHIAKKEYTTVLTYIDNLLDYDPLQITRYVDFGLKAGLSATTAESKMNNFISNYGRGEEFAAFMKIRYKDRDEINVFQDTIDYLKQYSKETESENLEIALSLLRKWLDVSDIAQCKEYYNILTIVALNQPSDEAHIKIVSKILNEKKKLETIMPEVRN